MADGAAPPGGTTTDAPDDLCALAAEAIHVLRYGKPSEGLLTAADCDLASAALDAVWPVITAGAAAEARRKIREALELAITTYRHEWKDQEADSLVAFAKAADLLGGDDDGR